MFQITKGQVFMYVLVYVMARGQGRCFPLLAAFHIIIIFIETVPL